MAVERPVGVEGVVGPEARGAAGLTSNFSGGGDVLGSEVLAVEGAEALLAKPEKVETDAAGKVEDGEIFGYLFGEPETALPGFPTVSTVAERVLKPRVDAVPVEDGIGKG